MVRKCGGRAIKSDPDWFIYIAFIRIGTFFAKFFFFFLKFEQDTSISVDCLWREKFVWRFY